MAVVRSEIEISTHDGKAAAYLSESGSIKGPGVVVVSSIFGVNQELKDMCDDLAARGGVVLAPNFFWRDEDPGVLALPADIQRAIARVMRIDFGKAMGDLASGIAEVRRNPSCNGKVAVIGLCFGGPFAWRAACDLGVDAAVSLHGTHVSKGMRPGDKPNCPVSFHYGDMDDLAPPEELDAVRKMAGGSNSEFVIHPGAGHGYMMRADTRHFDADAARKSWDRTLEMVDALRT